MHLRLIVVSPRVRTNYKDLKKKKLKERTTQFSSINQFQQLYEHRTSYYKRVTSINAIICRAVYIIQHTTYSMPNWRLVAWRICLYVFSVNGLPAAWRHKNIVSPPPHHHHYVSVWLKITSSPTEKYKRRAKPKSRAEPRRHCRHRRLDDVLFIGVQLWPYSFLYIHTQPTASTNAHFITKDEEEITVPLRHQAISRDIEVLFHPDGR